MKQSSAIAVNSALIMELKRCSITLVLLFLILVSTGIELRANQTLTVRSGNGTSGSQDTQVRVFRYGRQGDITPTAADFVAAQTAQFAWIEPGCCGYVFPLPSDPTVQWIGTTPGFNPESALYAIPFQITDQVIISATLDLPYAVDNAINGVFINGIRISGNSFDGDYHSEFRFVRSDIGPLLRPNATNWLYLNVSDYGGISALIFRAKITTQGGASQRIIPNIGGNAGQVSVKILGQGFPSGPVSVTLQGVALPIIAGTASQVINATEIDTTFDLTGAVPGIRDLVITQNGAPIILSNAFTIELGGAPELTIQILGPSRVRAGRQANFEAIIQNHGSVDASIVAASIAGASFGPQPLIGGSQSSTTINQASLLPNGILGTGLAPIGAFSSIILPITVGVPPGTCGSIIGTIHRVQQGDPCAAFKAAKKASEGYLDSLYKGRLANLLVWEKSILPTLAGGNGLCFNVLNPPSATYCDSLQAIDDNFDSAIKSAESAELGLCALAASAGCPLNCNDPTEIHLIKNISDALRVTIDQLRRVFGLAQIPPDQIAPLDNQVSLFLTQALALPGSLVFPPQPTPPPNSTDLPIDDISSAQVCPVTSVDPNAKAGPIGVGPNQYIPLSTPLAYSISFENLPTASAAAARVVVTDQLDPNLDLSTLAVTGVQIGQKAIPITPTNIQNSISRLDLRPDQNALVDISVSVANSVLTVTMETLDPLTGFPPTNSLSGFLPPDTNPPQGEGVISYIVMPKLGIPTGAQIQNQASVVFDENAPIRTGVWLNTVDGTAPISEVLSLPPSVPSMFTVQWQGSDAGSGLKDFSIYVSDNGGPPFAWLTNTQATQGFFNGAWGHKYGFYTIARDLAGNVENRKISEEASTQVNIDMTPPVIVAQISGTPGNNGWYRSAVTVNWSVTDPESGIASSSGCNATALTADTAGVTLTCSAQNGAGLSSSVPVTIKIDKTAPVILGLPVRGCALWPPNHKLVQVATVTAADALSDLAPGTFQVTGTSNEPSDPQIPQIVITPNASGGFGVQLQADRLGTGNGRAYTLTATAVDLAGNSSIVTTTCNVPHDQGK